METSEWGKLEKLFGGEKSTLRKIIFLYLYIMGPKHIYRIGKELEKIGLAKSTRSVIETINKLRKHGFFVEKEEIINNRKRTIIDINWNMLLNTFINEISKYEEFTDEEIKKIKEKFFSNFNEVKRFIIDMPNVFEISGEQLKEVLVSDLKKVDLFTLIAGPLFIIFNKTDKNLANKLSRAITKYYVSHQQRAQNIFSLLLSRTLVSTNLPR